MRKRLRMEPVGQHHDLGRIFERLNERYFQQSDQRGHHLRPGARVKGPRKSIKMGSYSADSKVIRIHPALDQPEVPRYFVEWIVFHEMLHHVYRARRGDDGRRCVHPPEFMEHERRFHDFTRAQAWEDENLDLLLRARVLSGGMVRPGDGFGGDGFSALRGAEDVNGHACVHVHRHADVHCSRRAGRGRRSGRLLAG